MQNDRTGPVALALALACVPLLAACDREDETAVRMDPPPAAMGVEPEQQPTPGFDVLQAGDFRPPPGSPDGSFGRATVLMPSAEAGMPDGMQLEVRLQGLEPGVEHGWHLHMGRCGEDGPVIVGLSPGAEQEGAVGGRTPAVAETRAVGRALVAAHDGAATQVVVLPTGQITPQELPLRPYSVRVYRGLAPDAAQLVACAELGSAGEAVRPR
jgi:hypothetical protein